MSAASVRLRIDGDVGFILIDNPPVNAGSAGVRLGLRNAVRRLAADDGLVGGVIIGAGKTFMAGSDIREFGKPLQEPDLPSVILEIEQCRKPIVAAIDGVALGGGYELALACDGRLATREAVVGLPEVTLGMIPGAGGTQRLPRLVGIAQSFDLIVSGRRVAALEALALGLIDGIAEGDLAGFAADWVRRMAGRKSRVRDRSVPSDATGDLALAEKTALRKGHGREAVREALRVIKLSISTSFEQALSSEREVFQRLRIGEDAAALRYNFFAEREASKLEGMEGRAARVIQKVGVVGAGTMGAGIAAVFAASGYHVTLVDTTEEALARGLDLVAVAIHDLARSGRLGTGGLDAVWGRLIPSMSLDGLSDADLIIEAVFEDMAAKREVLSALGLVLKPGAIIASNTSYLDIDELALATGRPEDVVGLHFFAPVHRMRLVEVVRNARTTPDVLLTGVSVSKIVGKLPIVTGCSEGFIGNRIYAKYRQQCEFLLEEGALPHEVDAAVEELGFAMGPFAAGDLSGLDIAWRNRLRKAAARDPRERYVEIADRICELGRLGRKTGAGWYTYAGATGKAQPDPIVTEIVRRYAVKRESSMPLSGEQIRRRALGAVLNEAALIVEESSARSGREIDLVLVNGFGFSKFKGGPLFLASRRPPAEIETMITEVETATGFGFRRGDVARLLAGLGE
ncbi:enoyl-CoA hydratase/isomerase family protein [Mesorhizobium sp. AD1-1]|uniref:3-hydroxyacyl-CoA dehydrogenase NAD-binding domain-containing protein n=1 Tax=Mesorhizobium sp. AD1-1 TaxID=2876621 RepID=UPI001CCD1641|nr:3-hydroxyacyl-CoA dehydrogenase NAD-binding domain-containing protein [Mesorhizobium sp. AD1-1]MBZ9719203.1 enoyl-CoA hydratase/isomerase family protein [Mesorhizobium sp. AD1-1]